MNNETFKVINTSLTDLKNNESLLYSRTVVPNGVELSPRGKPRNVWEKKKASAGHNDWMAPVDRKTDLWHPAMIPKVEISHTNFVPLNLYN